METHKPQLQMLWTECRLAEPPEVKLPPGYCLRTYRDSDADAYIALMHSAGFTHFTRDVIASCMQRILPDGFFVIEAPNGDLVATAMANHAPAPLHPYGGELGWVAGSQAHAGKGLGMSVCAAVVRRFISAGYRRIYLLTDDWRLPALKVYLRLGFEPFLFAPDMSARWQAVCDQLAWPYTPDRWSGVPFESVRRETGAA